MTQLVDWHEHLTRLRACSEAVEWAKQYDTFTAAWLACERGDWMLWLAAKAGVDRKLLVLTACACARTSLKLVTPSENRPRIAIETAERWTRGEATIDEVRTAASASAAAYAASADAYAYAACAADAAAYAASACAADAAAYAAYAAADDADDDDAADADADADDDDAADAAADDAAAAAAADACAVDAAAYAAYADDDRPQALKKCADLVRETITAHRVQAAWRTR